MKRKKIELSAGSMADIAFLLLIFFLVSTTTDKEKGIMRQMSPKKSGTKVAKHPAFEITINAQEEILINGEMSKKEKLSDALSQYLLSENSLNWEEKNLFEGKSIQVNSFVDLNYGFYVEVQDEIQKTYKALRNQLAMERFNQSMEELKEMDVKAYQEIIQKTPVLLKERLISGV